MKTKMKIKVGLTSCIWFTEEGGQRDSNAHYTPNLTHKVLYNNGSCEGKPSVLSNSGEKERIPLAISKNHY